jgi:hypothetical protein
LRQARQRFGGLLVLLRHLFGELTDFVAFGSRLRELANRRLGLIVDQQAGRQEKVGARRLPVASAGRLTTGRRLIGACFRLSFSRTRRWTVFRVARGAFLLSANPSG